jgi:hypothetical protein
MENRNLPILHENSSLSVFPAYRQAGVPRMSPCLLGANLPARSRFGVGRWVVKIALTVNYFLLLMIKKNFEILIHALQGHASMYKN